MIASLRGILDAVFEDHIVIDVGGVGYAVVVSLRTATALPEVGASVALRIFTRSSDDSITLYGFVSHEEITCFRMLISVPGIGTKAAVAILSHLDPPALGRAISDGRAVDIAGAQGVGRKLAARIAVELAPKLPKWPSAIGAGSDQDGNSRGVVTSPEATGGLSGGYSSDNADAISALVNLGYSSNLAEQMISKAVKTLAESREADEPHSVRELVKVALSGARMRS